jgi:hypothetical protein
MFTGTLRNIGWIFIKDKKQEAKSAPNSKKRNNPTVLASKPVKNGKSGEADRI